jgi:hypothetical protein
MTMLIFEWPNIAAKVTRSTPACAILVAQVCLQSYSRKGATLQRLSAAVCAAFTFTIGPASSGFTQQERVRETEADSSWRDD